MSRTVGGTEGREGGGHAFVTPLSLSLSLSPSLALATNGLISDNVSPGKNSLCVLPPSRACACVQTPAHHCADLNFHAL